jgi:hypothetical protein
MHFQMQTVFIGGSVGIDFLQLIIILRRSFVQNLFYIFLVFLYHGLLNACDFLEHFLYRLSSSTWGLRRGILGLKLII